MLVCPQCQFENPNTNKFCQRCGTSLTHKPCPECSTQVPINAETCHSCGAFTGTVWWAIIANDPNSQPATTDAQAAPLAVSDNLTSNAPQVEKSNSEIPVALGEASAVETSPEEQEIAASDFSSQLHNEQDNPEADSSPAFASAPNQESEDVTLSLSSPLTSTVPEKASKDNHNSKTSSPNPVVIYLDPQQRYRLLEEPQSLPSTAAVGSPYGTSVRVLDSQPLQKSLLEALMDQKQGNHQLLELSQTKEGMPQASTMPSDAWKALGIPPIAQPYLALNESYYPTLPAVHDAWEEDGKAVVLLEDRSGWQLLADLWGNSEFSSLQILYWLDEMAKLWNALEPWNCRQSLLESHNLRVDEDQVLGLMCLYPEDKEQPLTLQDLGKMWQRLFDQSQRTQFTSLSSVFRQLCSNEITTISELRSHLEAIAHEQQGPAPGVAQYPDFDENSEPEESATTVAIKPPFPDSSLGSDEDMPTVILPMQLLSLDDVGCTDIGHQRQHNEDCFGIQTQIKKQENPMGRSVEARGLYILCDGMGGHAAGEVASAMAVETLKRYFEDNWHDQLPTEESIREAVRIANQAIYDVNQQNARSGSGRMGTTLVMILIHNTEAAIAHVGDSRLYRLTRRRGLEQLTVDHEVGQREIARGVDPEIAYSRPDAYQLTQAVGPRSEHLINPDVKFLELNEDSLFVLCSDGLSDNNLIETHWQTHLAPLLSSRANLEQGRDQLIDLANKYNGHDNITAILIRVKVRPNFEQQQLR